MGCLPTTAGVGAEVGREGAGPLQLVRDDAELHAVLRLHRTLLDGLLGVTRAIARRAPLQEVLDAIVLCAQELLDDGSAAIVLRDADAGAGAGREPDPAQATPIVVGGEVIGWLVVPPRRCATGCSPTEQDALRLLAEHAGLALGDARTVRDMAHRAVHDQLTGLATRAVLNDRLAQALDRAGREGTGVAVLRCDLDRFKRVNDSLGQAAGDELLRVTARRLRLAVGAGGTAARLSGDEFALLLEDVGSAQDAERTAARVLRHLQEPVVIAGRAVPGGASIGIAHSDGSDARDLLRAADLALHRAKATGRGRTTTFAPEMEEEALDRLELEADLRQAVDRGQIELAYQPLVDLPTSAVLGFEDHRPRPIAE